MNDTKKYKSYGVRKFEEIPQVQKYLSKEDRFSIKVVSEVLPFRTCNYVIDELIDWSNFQNDPMYILNFPKEEMLEPEHFRRIADLKSSEASREEIDKAVYDIRMELNPHPAGQLEYNIPEIDGMKLTGLQHKYHETMLIFPWHGQTCHAYCTFCFRWPQFVGIDELKFAMREMKYTVKYLKSHTEISDYLITGGDPLTMSAERMKRYILPVLDENIENIRNIRIGTKVLSYWPYRFLTDKDSDELLQLFEKVIASGRHLALMAHFNHPAELKTEAVREAIKKLRGIGVQIRTQSPILKHINDSPDVWSELWKTQVSLGCIPYYMFIARNTGAQNYFAVPLVKTHTIFSAAYRQVSGLCRTVRGPSMSAAPGKVQVLGVSKIGNEKVIILRFLQGRNPEWVHKPFFAEYDEEAIWLDDLKPALGESKFFFEN